MPFRARLLDVWARQWTQHLSTSAVISSTRMVTLHRRQIQSKIGNCTSSPVQCDRFEQFLTKDWDNHPKNIGTEHRESTTATHRL
jgi:hypothetical protein